MNGVSGLGYYFPWFATESYLDTQLNQARSNPHIYPSNALIHFSDNWFNFKNDPQFPLKVSDEVKWQILFAAKAQINSYGIIELGENFSVQHLSTEDLVFLYRILNAYHNLEKTQFEGKWAIFHKHLDVIENRFKQLSSLNGWHGLKIIYALKSYDDANLVSITVKMESFVEGIPPSRFVPIAKKPIGIPNEGANCWANSLMQLILQIPSFEQAILHHPNFRDPVYEPFRNFLIAYRRDQNSGRAVLNSVSSQSIRQAFHRMAPDQFSLAARSEAILTAFSLLMTTMPNENPLMTATEYRNRRGEMSYGNMYNCFMEKNEIVREGFVESYKKTISQNSYPNSFHFMKSPEEFFVQIPRFDGRKVYLDEIDVPAYWQMPKDLLSIEENVYYECDAFIISNGHDVTYVKNNGVFYMCDDALVQPLLPEQAESARKKAAFFHYKKVIL